MASDPTALQSVSQTNIEKNRRIYNIAQWSQGYFDINEQGEVVAFPFRRRNAPGIPLSKLSEALGTEQLALPVLVRFIDILTDRVDSLHAAFEQAMTTYAYTGRYTSAYPIKVNQQRDVAQQIIQHKSANVGLEAGSKPELMAVLALAQPAGRMIICNGYKDREYIRLALIGQKLGHRVYIIIEKLSELAVVLAEAEKLAVEPHIGVRVRLAATGKGKWQSSGGEKAKFGLTAAQVLEVINCLEKRQQLHCLQLLHFHLGSQVANIRDIQGGLKEAAHYFAQLCQLKAPIECVDVGGGLGVDYEGTASRSDCSINYSLNEYANNVVSAFAEICQQYDLPHPHIITESGRAMTAHHAVLITNVIDAEIIEPPENLPPPAADEPPVLQELWQVLVRISERAAVTESYHDACYCLAETHSLYIHGMLNLRQRAWAEQMYQRCCLRIRDLLNPRVKAHQDILDSLNERLADKYFVNFSLFQSTPDAWAIDQIFPILPLENLQELPSRRVVLEDLTCDSDGCIDRYIDGLGVDSTVPLPPYKAGERYLLGIFLVGAYQEILGDMHNLFGDTDAVNVVCDEKGNFRLSHAEQGDTVEDVLRYVHFEKDKMLHSYQQQMAASGLDIVSQQAYLTELIEGLQGYTYFEGV